MNDDTLKIRVLVTSRDQARARGIRELLEQAIEALITEAGIDARFERSRINDRPLLAGIPIEPMITLDDLLADDEEGEE